MCIAIYCNVGHVLSDDQIRTSWRNNSDGGGFTYVADGALQTFRTMDVSEFVDAYRLATDAHAHRSDFAVHFRYATHGTTNVANVHPFPMDAHTNVCHNGILSTPVKGDGRSDTSTFVSDYLPLLGATWFDVPELWEMVSEYCAGSKLIVMTTHPDAQRGAYIVNESDGHWSDDGGMWFSNATYCDARPPKTGRYALPWDAWSNAHTSPTLGVCEMCMDASVVADRVTGTDVCYSCGTCQECGGDVDSDVYACECDTGAMASDVSFPEWNAMRTHAMTLDQWTERN